MVSLTSQGVRLLSLNYDLQTDVSAVGSTDESNFKLTTNHTLIFIIINPLIY